MASNAKFAVSHVYAPNQGYQHAEPITAEFLSAQNTATAVREGENDEDLESNLDDDEDVDDTEWVAEGFADLRELQTNNKTSDLSAPRSITQKKPKANTRVEIDDQMDGLSRHAGKIRLDSVLCGNSKGGAEKDKDKADRATTELVLDWRTRIILLRMINGGLVSEIHGAVSTGKEANVYGAVLYPVDDADGKPIQRAIKVYKTSILVFKDRERYVAGEHRFRTAEKGNNRKMVQQWAEKEFRNLKRLHAAGIACPAPIRLKLHVLVMEFLGNNRGWAYPKLRDANIEDDDAEDQWRSLYVQLLGIMRRLYQVCHLVHADLSEYNILYHDHRLFIIDVSQSVEHDHPCSLEFLRMDIKNVGDFFRQKGVDALADRTVFNFITAPEGAVEEPALSQAIDYLYQVRAPVDADDEAAAAENEIDNEVFRTQFIPRTLDEVYDMEKGTKKGSHDETIYQGLLAVKVVRPKEAREDSSSQPDSSGGEGATLDVSDSDEEDGSGYGKGRPRGRKFEGKDEKKQHKQAVKEAKRAKRKDKMPKSVKKRLVATSARKKK